jgi:TonB-dependent SusC/RagA subfamily outer membrane receptor
MKEKLLLILLLLTSLLQQAAAQNRPLAGQVVDQADGQGLPGVTVLVKGTTVGTSTSVDGTYALSVPASATTLIFSFVGYGTVEQPIGTGATLNVRLHTDAKQLGEVVVTGALGIQRQAQELGYATATVGAKELNQARVTNVTNGLAGKVSGLQIQTVNNGINPSVRVTLRGTRSLTGENQALVVIDGVQTSQDVLTALNPDDIADITVLKGANAAALYGSQATNGALVITTKRGGTKPSVTYTHTSQLEQISFWPKLQNEFGPGSTEWVQTYNPYENQQYGDRYDGSVRNLGSTTQSGNIQRITYEARPQERKDFFNTGYQMQNNISFSGGDKDTKIFVSYQNVRNSGIVPKDKYERNTFRANASRQMNKLSVGMNVSYSYNNVDQTTAAIYQQLLNTSSLIPFSQYKNGKTTSSQTLTAITTSTIPILISRSTTTGARLAKARSLAILI